MYQTLRQFHFMNGHDKMLFKYFFLFKIAIGIFLMSLTGFVLIAQEAGLLTEIVLGYALGSIPFGYILTRLKLKQDIRSFGSGNIGATNVLRTGNKFLAALTLLLDAAKGGVAVAWLSLYSSDPNITYFIGIAAMMGHIFPIWLDFKGGKGVATGLGILLALSFPLATAALLTWIIIALLFRYSSSASLWLKTLMGLERPPLAARSEKFSRAT